MFIKFSAIVAVVLLFVHRVSPFRSEAMDHEMDDYVNSLARSTEFYKSCASPSTDSFMNLDHASRDIISSRLSLLDDGMDMTEALVTWHYYSWLLPFRVSLTMNQIGQYVYVVQPVEWMVHGQDSMTYCETHVEDIVTHWRTVLDRIRSPLSGRLSKAEIGTICEMNMQWSHDYGGSNLPQVVLEWKSFSVVKPTESSRLVERIIKSSQSLHISNEKNIVSTGYYIDGAHVEGLCRIIDRLLHAKGNEAKVYLYYSMTWSLFHKRQYWTDQRVLNCDVGNVQHEAFYMLNLLHSRSAPKCSYRAQYSPLTCLEFTRIFLQDSLNMKLCSQSGDTKGHASEIFTRVKTFLRFPGRKDMAKMHSVSLKHGCEYYQQRSSTSDKNSTKGRTLESNRSHRSRANKDDDDNLIKTNDHWTEIIALCPETIGSSLSNRVENQWTYSAYYHPLTNSIYITEALSRRARDASLGDKRAVVEAHFIMGHELSHSVDEKGSMFDEKGAWVNRGSKVPVTRDQHVVKAYDYYPYNDGSKTYNENMADIYGISVSWRVYTTWCIRNKSPVECTMRNFEDIYKTMWGDKESVYSDGTHSSEELRKTVPLTFLWSEFGRNMQDHADG